MPTDKRPPYIRIADEAADAARVADQRQRIPRPAARCALTPTASSAPRSIPSLSVDPDAPTTIREMHTRAVLDLQAAAEAYADRRGKGGDEMEAHEMHMIAALRFAAVESLIARAS